LRAVTISYANMLLFLPALVKRLVEQRFPPRIPRSDLQVPVGPLNDLLCAILSIEAPLVARGGLPFGLSVIALGQKFK
jgi:hypothetical protein